MPKSNLPRRDSIDPEVSALLKEMEQRQVDAQMPRREREKKARERQKIADRRERRATYDLPPHIRNQISDLSTRLSIPASQLVTLALIRFLESFNAGGLDLGPLKTPSRSPRYDWNLVIPDLQTDDQKRNKKRSRSLPVEKVVN
jgi:hypothetical protein